MEFKRFCQSIILAASVVISVKSFAGPADGGGGGAFVCREASGEIKSSELMDLWEAKNRKALWERPEPYKLNIPYTGESIDVQMDHALTRIREIDSDFYEHVVMNLFYLRGHIDEVPDDQELLTPPDAYPWYGHLGCPFEGMMHYDNDIRKLSIKLSIFNKPISSTAQAASWTHEAIYKSLRELKAVSNDSRQVRKLNACLYATDDCLGVKDAGFKVPKDGREVLKCQSADYDLYLVNEGIVEQDLFGRGYKTKYQEYTAYANRIGSTNYTIPAQGHIRFDINDFNQSGQKEFHYESASVKFSNLIGERFFDQMLNITDSVYGDQMVVWPYARPSLKTINMAERTLLATKRILPKQDVTCETFKP